MELILFIIVINLMPKDSKKASPVKSEARRSLKWQLGSFLIAIGLVFFISFAYVNSLWSQKYLQEVEATWELSPIVDLQLVDQNSNGCPTGYDVATSGVFPGYYAGCDCSQTRRSKF